MNIRPILFSGPMVRALLNGQKTQTRRIIKGGPECDWFVDPSPRGDGLVWVDPEGSPSLPIPLPCAVGDRLWVREAWSGPYAWRDMKPSDRARCGAPSACEAWYWSDGDPRSGDWEKPRPSTHMPRWASRLTLVVTDVRVQPLQEISEADAVAEGCRPFFDHSHPEMMGCDKDIPMAPLIGPVDAFGSLWNTIHGPDAWDANPWVAAYTFTVHRCNVDQMLRNE